MKTFLFSFLLLFCGIHSGLSQILLPTMHDTTFSGRSITVSGGAFQSSTALYNSFTRKLVLGGAITTDLSLKTHHKQKKYNKIGGGYSASIIYKDSYSIFKSNKKWSWMINASANLHFSGRYTDDLFGLIFIGNKPYLGKNATLANTQFRMEQFLSIGGGIHNKKTKSFVTINAILPQQFAQLVIDKGSIAFSESADKIDLTTEGELYLANKAPYFKGLGVAVNFDYCIPFGNPESFHGIIQVSGRNLGAYQMTAMRDYTAEISKSYTGFDIETLTQQEEFPNLMDTLGIQEGKTTQWRVLPGYLQIGKVVSANTTAKLQPFFGVRMYMDLLYQPLLYVGGHYQPIPEFSIGLQGSYGGYANFRLGLYVHYKSDHFSVGLGTENILGAFLKTRYGHSGLVQLQYKF